MTPRLRIRSDEREAADVRPAPERAPATAVLALQRTAGNLAVGRMLARAPAHPRQTGLRSDQAVHRFAHKALAFLRRNGDGTLNEYALYLGAAANEELAAVGVPAANVVVSPGTMEAAAEFDPSTWSIALNPREFSHRAEVQRMGDLNDDEAGIIAMRVMHEARHAEQNFRVARLAAADGQDLGIPFDEDAADAAAAAPLNKRTAGGQELREAQQWRTNLMGADAVYREAVTWWQRPAVQAALRARDVTAANAADTRERLVRQIHDWAKPGGPADTVRSHLAGARSRHATLVATDVKRIDGAFRRAEEAAAQLPEGAQPAEFHALAEALAELTRAVTTAYRDQPVEHDAYDTGVAVFDAYSKEAVPAGAH